MRIPINRYWLKPRDFHFALLLTLTSGAIPRLSAASVITSVVNAASYGDPQLPGSLIGEGSIFIARGTGLGPADLTIAPSAFQSTSLSGTSVSVSVNGQTVNALMYYTSATQVAALLPSKTPTGGVGSANPNAQVTVTVTYNGEDSTPTPFQGCGGANTACGSAHAGDPLTLWATGLGPTLGGDGASSLATKASLKRTRI
jgi:uncharacterized protein (TIGR03437 family)